MTPPDDPRRPDAPDPREPNDPGDSRFLEPYFLGPSAENAKMVEELLLELFRDHAYWRRNFHPEDGEFVSPGASHDPEYLEFVSRTRAELYRLSAELKRAVPFFHPRYIGHMSADLLIPGVIARIVTTLYNPNNVSEEAAPVTLEKELEVGEQLARMFGFPTDDAREPCAWGHLTSGGTIANYEALWNFRSVKFWPIALAEAARTTGRDLGPIGPGDRPLPECSKHELLQLSIGETIELRGRVAAELRRTATREEAVGFARAIRGARIETLGTAGFFLEHRDLAPPRVVVPTSAHYSWEKAMKVLGLGTANLVRVPVDDHMRLDVGALEETLEDLLRDCTPVLAAIAVLGTTEFGTIDPVHEVVRLRDAFAGRGLGFPIHVDAAWGGYLASIFRRPDGGFVPHAELRSRFHYFPSEQVHGAFAALGEVDSITVDPHKMGYVPYSAGAFLARDRRVVDFVTQRAAYVFDLGEADRDVPMREKLRGLGRYILEGSKPGASAAAVHVTHRVLPLDETGFGRLLSWTVHACETFFEKIGELGERLRGRVRLVIPFEPDTNLVCVAMNPEGNTSLARMNRFSREIFGGMKVDPSRPLQVKSFIASYTSLLVDSLRPEQRGRLLAELGVDPDTFVELPGRPEEADHVFVLRHTLMNPWLLREQDGRTMIDRYVEYLETWVDEVLRGGTWQ